MSGSRSSLGAGWSLFRRMLTMSKIAAKQPSMSIIRSLHDESCDQECRRLSEPHF